MAEQPSGTGPGDDGTAGKPTGPVTGWQRLSRTFFNPPKPKPQTPKVAKPPPDFSKMTDAEKKVLVNQIDPMERKIGYAASALAAVLTLVATVPYMVSKTLVTTTVKPVGHTCTHGYLYTKGATGKAPTCNGYYPASHYAFYLIVLLIFALAIFVTVRIGRRAPLAFTMVLTGLALGSFSANTIVVLPFLIGGGWLLLRAWRSQRYGSPTAKAPIAGYTPPARGAGARAGAKGSGTSTTNATRRSRKGQPSQPATGRQAPEQNKRYTPKAPPKPKKKVPPAD